MTRNNLASHLLGLSLLSAFIPYKIYPVIYVLSSLIILSMGITKKNLTVFIFALMYCLYGVFVYITGGFGNEESDLAITKLIFNCGFFLAISISGVFSEKNANDNSSSLLVIERYLSFVVIASLIQVLFLQIISGGIRFSSDNSYTAGLMFTDHAILWGVQDKNIMGAKIALFGFLHAYTYYRLKGKINYIFGMLYILCSALTLSRTSLLLSLLTFFLLIYLNTRYIYRYYIILPLIFFSAILLFPKIAELVRLDSITNVSRDDGMGIRILFWTAFFSRFTDISFWGEGLLSASAFLGQYSVTGSANNMHNLYINNYLDLGVPGSVFYLLFLMAIIFKVYKRNRNRTHTLLMIAPILVVTNTLYTGYDNDTWMYYSILLVISNFTILKKHP